MFKKFAAALCLLGLLLGLAGCGEVAGDIAGNVVEAAKKELENQVRTTFEKYKVEVIELKTSVGKLNGSSGENQFFCAALVESDSDAIPQSVADNLAKIFHNAGITVQVGSQVEHSYLEHKTITYKYSDFAESKTYYTVWCYTDRLPSLEDLKNLVPSESGTGVG